MTHLKKYLLAFLLLEMFFSYAPAFAQTTNTIPDYSQAGVSTQIEKYLCSPNGAIGTNTVNQNISVANSNPLFLCINQLYKFAIVIASVVGVFFIVIAGYIYMSAEGNNESVEKAKSILTSTITALVILLAGYVLLRALNPDLVQFQSIQPQNVTLTPSSPVGTGTTGGGTGAGGTTGTGGTGSTSGGGGTTPVVGGTISGSGGGTAGSGVCSPITDPSNPASVSNLQSSCLSANATLFSEIAYEETRGQSIPSGSDKCADGNPVSFGFFQINITSSPLTVGGVPCSSAFSSAYTATNKTCVVTNQSLYQQCVAAILDPSQNIQTACIMSNNGTSLTPWNGSCFAKWTSN